MSARPSPAPHQAIPQRAGFLEQARHDRTSRRRLRRAGLGVVAVGLVVAGGAAAAAPLPRPDTPKQFGQTKTGLFADTTRAVVTPEGYVIRAYLYAMDLRSVIPLGRGLNSYEAFVSATGKATIGYKDPKHPPKLPVKSASVAVHMTIACPVTPQSLQISGTTGNTTGGSVTPGLSGTLSGTGQGSGGSSGGTGGGSVTASVTPSISATANTSFNNSGTISGTLAPGVAKDFPLASKNLEGTAGYVTTRETRAAVDGCLGGAQVRLSAVATISTSLGTSSTTTYGKPIFIERDNPGPARKPPKAIVRDDKHPAPTPAQAVSTPTAAPKPVPAKPAPAKKPVPAKPAPTTKPAPAGR